MALYFGFALPHYVVNTWANGMSIIYYLRGLIESKGVATVADYNRAIGYPSKEEDNYFGWNDLSGAAVKDVGNGKYEVVLPTINTTVNHI